jgi:tetratricopeptide (TPR) repeat protein
LIEPSDEFTLAEVDTSSNAVLPEAINNSPQDDKEHDPKDTSNGIESNQANKDTQRVAEDIATYKKVTEINPRNAFAWDTLGNLYKTSGSYREAVTSFEQAVSLDPNKALYRYNLGLVYAIQQRYDEAIGAFEKVVEFDPGNRLAHATLAGYYRRLGQDAEAKKHITIAMSTMKDENEYNRACFEAICGNADQAIELLKVALEQEQTSLDWARRDPDLDFIREDPRYKALVNAEVGVSS